MKKIKTGFSLNFLNLILLAVSLVYLLYGYLHAMIAIACDGYLRWAECACLLHGIYPMDIILGRLSIQAPYTHFDNTATTIPWSYLLSNFFYPGFLTWPQARMWALMLFTVCFLLSMLLLWKYLRRITGNRNFFFLTVLIWSSNFGWGSALTKVNNGMFTCISILVVLLLLEYGENSLRNDIFLALLMVVAMLKPQIALLFYIPLLYRKKYRSIFLSGVILLAAWIGAAVLLQISPLTILLEQFQVGADLKVTSVYVYYGLFDFLTRFGISTRFIMILQFAVFIPLAFVLGYMLRKSSMWIQFAVPSVLTLLWCYHHNTDLQVIGILMICIGHLMVNAHHNTRLQLCCLLLLLFNLLPISYAYYDITPALPFLQRMVYLAGLILVIRHRDEIVFPIDSSV